MSFDVCLVELSEAAATHGEKSREVAEALQKMIHVLNQNGQARKCLPLLLRLKEVRQDLGLDCTETKKDIRALLLTSDWPISEHSQDDGASPSSTSTWNLNEHADAVSKIAGSVGALTLGLVLRGSGKTAELAIGGATYSSQIASALCLESGRTKSALVFKAVDIFGRTAGSTWSYASSIGAVFVETAAQPIITFSTRSLLNGAALTVQSAGGVWNAVAGMATWTRGTSEDSKSLQTNQA